MRQLLFAVTDLTLHSSHDPASGVTVHDVYKKVAETYSVTEPMECGPARPQPPASPSGVPNASGSAGTTASSAASRTSLRVATPRGTTLTSGLRCSPPTPSRHSRRLGSTTRPRCSLARHCHCQCRHHLLFRLQRLLLNTHRHFSPRRCRRPVCASATPCSAWAAGRRPSRSSRSSAAASRSRTRSCATPASSPPRQPVVCAGEQRVRVRGKREHACSFRMTPARFH
jgi:hypothetical protein